MIQNNDVPPLRSENRGFDRDLEAIVAKAVERAILPKLAQSRSARGPRGSYLDLYLDGKTLPIRRPGMRERTGRWLRKHGLAAASLLLAAVVPVFLFIALFRKPVPPIDDKSKRAGNGREGSKGAADLANCCWQPTGFDVRGPNERIEQGDLAAALPGYLRRAVARSPAANDAFSKATRRGSHQVRSVLGRSPRLRHIWTMLGSDAAGNALAVQQFPRRRRRRGRRGCASWNIATGEAAFPNPLKHEGSDPLLRASALDGRRYPRSPAAPRSGRPRPVWDSAKPLPWCTRFRLAMPIVDVAFDPEGSQVVVSAGRRTVTVAYDVKVPVDPEGLSQFGPRTRTAHRGQSRTDPNASPPTR